MKFVTGSYKTSIVTLQVYIMIPIMQHGYIYGMVKKLTATVKLRKLFTALAAMIVNSKNTQKDLVGSEIGSRAEISTTELTVKNS